MEGMQQQYGNQGLQVISLGSQWNQPYSCTSWATTFGLTFPILDDDSYSVGSLFSVNGVPFTVIIDHTMVLRYRALGFNQSVVVATIEDLLTELDVSESASVLSENFSLRPAYPNPFNASVTIPFTLTREEDMSVTVHDITGRVVATLAKGMMPAGEHVIRWSPVVRSTGIYFISVASGTQHLVYKIVQVK